jgi:hypothetical protein
MIDPKYNIDPDRSFLEPTPQSDEDYSGGAIVLMTIVAALFLVFIQYIDVVIR